jgi:glycosyltransferase involved in cell wall biosynthesis
MPRSQRKQGLPLVIVAGQTPPPTGGQNIMIERILTELECDDRWRTVHWNFRFTPTFSTVRKAQFSKLLELVRVFIRALLLRFRHGRADLLLYPSGGPQTVPVIRDILLLPVAKWLSRSVWVQFHAAGIADRLKARNGVIAKLLLWAYRGVQGAIVMTNFNRCDPVALGIPKISIIPHRIPDENAEGHLPDFEKAESGKRKAESDVEDLRPDPPQPPVSGLRSPDSALNILYAGHLYDQKGTPQLVEAFGKIAADFPQTKLVLMGEFLPPYTEAICRARCAGLGIADRVEVTGILRGEKKAAQFRAAHLFVFPSVAPYESFGLVMAEAMMWGLPIIVTDWRGNRDVAGPDAFYVRVDNTMATHMADVLREAIFDPQRLLKLAAASRTRYETCHRLQTGESDYRCLVRDLMRKDEYISLKENL